MRFIILIMRLLCSRDFIKASLGQNKFFYPFHLPLIKQNYQSPEIKCFVIKLMNFV